MRQTVPISDRHSISPVAGSRSRLDLCPSPDTMKPIKEFLATRISVTRPYAVF